MDTLCWVFGRQMLGLCKYEINKKYNNFIFIVSTINNNLKKIQKIINTQDIKNLHV